MPINDFLAKLTKKQLDSLKSLEINLENLKDLNGLETVPKLKKLVFSMNKKGTFESFLTIGLFG